MGSDSSTEGPALAHPYAWWLELRVPSEEERRAGQLNMTASEQMFFVGAPLAHVVQYEDHLRKREQRGLLCAPKRKARFFLDDESARRRIALHREVVR
jgi:hypothetical protein